MGIRLKGEQVVPTRCPAVVPTEASQGDVRISTVTPEGEVWLGDVVRPFLILKDSILTIW